MTTANREFLDLMPHRIKVTGDGATVYDDWGQPVNAPDGRIYACLYDDTTTTVRSADGTEVTVSATVYVAPVPLNEDIMTPVDISSDETVEILDPPYGVRQVTSIERHWDAEDGHGMLHNMVVRF